MFKGVVFCFCNTRHQELKKRPLSQNKDINGKVAFCRLQMETKGLFCLGAKLPLYCVKLAV